MTRIVGTHVSAESIAYRTDRLFPAFDGEVLERRCGVFRAPVGS